MNEKVLTLWSDDFFRHPSWHFLGNHPRHYPHAYTLGVGMKEKEMKVIAELIHEALTKDTVSGIKRGVKDLCQKFRI